MIGRCWWQKRAPKAGQILIQTLPLAAALHQVTMNTRRFTASWLIKLQMMSSSESSEGETSTQSQPAYDKFNKMSFVKANVIYDCYESITFDDQNSPKLSDNGKAGIGFQRPENSKPSWLKNKLDKDKAKAGSKSFVPNQPRRNSRKAKSGWTKAQPRDLSGQKMKSKLNRYHSNYAQTLTDTYTGKTAFFTRLPTTMASSLISSSHHIDFDSVFGIDDAGMVQMFESLIATGLKEFLGCPAVFSEAALTEFFANSSVRDGMVVSTIKGKPVEISEEVFATTFELPTEGLTDLSEVPKNLVFDAQSLFSVSQEQAGSFDAVTRDRFLLMTAITFDVKVNWSRLLFDVLKDMVTPGSRQAKGLQQIKVDDKGKEPLKEKDPIKGRPHLEHYSLICADIDLLVKLRAQVIDEVDQFFNSFSLKKLATINVEDIVRVDAQLANLWRVGL
ncbi:hypothetical protein F511_40911 [Dorcoceras hygrometricum]|uniref:Uncharacterized protein n=1 Tax=Dorcoceras hygrometricum TaxID=472368 RepID=A0A2Z7ARP7_9LAMI|nr:hypothetical protein F511_40911 [Dorcoceras hygrometricum]